MTGNNGLILYIQVYSKKTKEKINEVVKKSLKNANIEDLSEDIFSCLDELIKNAVKANYKYLLIVDKINENLLKENPEKTHNEINEEVVSILKNHMKFDTLSGEILQNEDITKTVREILNEESKYISLKNKSFEEKRSLTEEDKENINMLPLLYDIRKKTLDKSLKIILKIEADDHFLYIEVINTAPILSKDLARIHEKRIEFKKYKDEGREHEFFINNLDTSESGFGLGYAKIDTYLSNWDLDPEKIVTIITSTNTTIMLTLPIAKLKEHTAALPQGLLREAQ